MNPVEALTQIRALCDDAGYAGLPSNLIARIRVVLDAVSEDATPPQGIDRDALWAIYDRYSIPNDVQEKRGLSFDDFCSSVLALVRPVEGNPSD